VRSEDKEALVILVGDHGAWLHRDCWVGAGPDFNENMRRNGFDPKDVARDLFEVFLAIRWPQPQPKHPLSHVNLFREVFANLSGQADIGKHQAAQDSYMRGSGTSDGEKQVMLAVKEGVLLSAWEPLLYAK
jgi:hypothetical protein